MDTPSLTLEFIVGCFAHTWPEAVADDYLLDEYFTHMHKELQTPTVKDMLNEQTLIRHIHRKFIGKYVCGRILTDAEVKTILEFLATYFGVYLEVQNCDSNTQSEWFCPGEMCYDVGVKLNFEQMKEKPVLKKYFTQLNKILQTGNNVSHSQKLRHPPALKRNIAPTPIFEPPTKKSLHDLHIERNTPNNNFEPNVFELPSTTNSANKKKFDQVLHTPETLIQQKIDMTMSPISKDKVSDSDVNLTNDAQCTALEVILESQRRVIKMAKDFSILRDRCTGDCQCCLLRLKVPKTRGRPPKKT